MGRFASWGNFPPARQQALDLYWRDDGLPLPRDGATLLPRGLGRSYGDSCLNDGGVLLDTRRLGRFIEFDRASGLLRCEAGLSLADLLAVTVPQGWFLPVTPGTKYVTVGGAVANDVHGKNHHGAGTFGRFVTRFELLRSDVKTEKIAVITEVMGFTEEESAAFWPVYREYEFDLSKLLDERVALIKDYAAHFDKMTDEKADELIKTNFKILDKRLSLQKKYFKRFKKVIPVTKAAKFMQLERQINMLIDLQIASELPLIEGSE